MIENGKIFPDETLDMEGRHDAIVVVLDADPWDAILSDPRPRAQLDALAEEAHQEYLLGKTTPLDPDAMP